MGLRDIKLRRFPDRAESLMVYFEVNIEGFLFLRQSITVKKIYQEQ